MAVLSKLLKYDFRANIKIFLFIWPAIVIFAVLERLAISADIEGSAGTLLVSTTTTVFVLAVIAAVVFSLVISIIRYYGGLLRSEGYLMFTLPVKPWQLIFSKFLTAFVTVLVTAVLSVLSVIFLFSGIDGMLEGIRQIWSMMDMPTGTTLILVILVCVVSTAMLLLQIYVACAIGHLFKRLRILFSVLAYYAINILIEIVTIAALIVVGANGYFDNISTSGGNCLLGGILCGLVVLCVVYYFVTERILRKKLNLE